ncbi:MAG: DNA polymerase IV [Clostridia bacterium]|nr:DNA polymerase IV [Clostridia bacterium]
MSEFCTEQFNKRRTILHCDLNSFFASVEVKHRPELQGKAVAVCGSKEDRHGIVLAKTNEAKRFGVKTGEAIWQAKRKCPDLITVEPHYRWYDEYSVAAREIYYRYTDQVESFGIDECWLDVTGSRLLFGDGVEIADKLREDMKRELELTISVGVSFNKIFAKLGSDMKKPDATTVISYDNFREKVWPLTVDEMMGIGPATKRKLAKHGIYTLGHLARLDIELCKHMLGKVGADLWLSVNGMGSDRVSDFFYSYPVKSIGRGNTFPHDLVTNEEARIRLYFLAEDVAYRLRAEGLCATKVQICIKNEELICRDIQAPLPYPTQSWAEIAEKAYEIFINNYTWKKNVRALTVRAIDLVPDDMPYQTDFFCDQHNRERIMTRELSVDKIRARYGNSAIETAAVFYYRQNAHEPGDRFDSLPKFGIRS